MNRWALVTAVVIAGFLATPLLVRPASAADVPTTLIAFSISWHLGSESGVAKPTIDVGAGDVLRLRVENHDGFPHTFTLPHFSVDRSLAAGSSSNPTVVFVNITTTTADNGKWQFYCNVPTHTTGTDPNRDGMVGWVQVSPVSDVLLIAFTTSWHVGSHSGSAKPTIQVNPGDLLRLRIENHDSDVHTFTLPHFSVDVNLPGGSPTAPFVAFVNITTTSADNGKWQFYCAVAGHASGTGENRDGMVGWVQVGAVRPPPTPGFEVVLVIAALGVVAVAARVLPRRQK